MIMDLFLVEKKEILKVKPIKLDTGVWSSNNVLTNDILRLFIHF